VVHRVAVQAADQLFGGVAGRCHPPILRVNRPSRPRGYHRRISRALRRRNLRRRICGLACSRSYPNQRVWFLRRPSRGLSGFPRSATEVCWLNTNNITSPFRCVVHSDAVGVEYPRAGSMSSVGPTLGSVGSCLEGQQVLLSDNPRYFATFRRTLRRPAGHFHQFNACTWQQLGPFRRRDHALDRADYEVGVLPGDHV
jgi:hypothetical protein